MDTTAIATIIAAKIAAETSFWVAIVGLGGVIVGAIITTFGNLGIHWLQDRPRRTLDKARIKILNKMLRDQRFPGHWRKLETLSRVIGANDETAKRLLIEVGARASEIDDGLWGLLEYHPLEKLGQ